MAHQKEAVTIDDTEIQNHVTTMQAALSHLLQLRNQSEQHATVINDVLCGIAERTIDLIDQKNLKKKLLDTRLVHQGIRLVNTILMTLNEINNGWIARVEINMA